MKERCSTFSLRKLPFKLLRLVIAAAFLLTNAFPAIAQTGVRVKGVVTSETDGLPLIGVNVVQRGTANGVVTDIDGNYELTVPVGAQLDFSYIGFHGQQLTVAAGKTVYNVTLREDSQSLEEVVVVGYGVQKKKLITGATVQVNGDDIQKLSTTSVLTALQSQTPGVTIVQNNGQPGSGYIVNIRGLGTIGDSKPLYVIDGVAGGDLNHISPSDIESIDVLKDAASSAIYGARAANGVVLVTTKQGKSGKIQISYDGYYGQQYMYKKPDLLTAQEYMTLVDEQRFNDGTPGYDWGGLLPKDLYQSFADGSSKGSDWVNAFYNEGAVTQSHAINLTGGNDVSKASLGYSYTQQDGILGTPVASTYNRSTVRLNSDHVLLKSQDMEVIKIGETLNYIYRTNSGISTGNIYWNGFHNVLVASPLLPIYDENGDWYDYYDKANNGWALDGNAGNPIAGVATSSQGLNLSKNHNLNMSAYLQIQPIRNLIFKSQFGYKMSASSYRSYDMKIRLSNNVNRTIESIGQSQSVGYSWTLDNTISYKLALDSHTADIVIGNSIEKWGMGENVSSGGSNNIFEGDWKYAWVDNTKPTELSQRNAGGSPWGAGRLASFFGRVNYNYAEKYMLSATLRADGSSNFAPGKRWGYFPSVSAGWVLTNEGFLEGAAGLLDFLKLRASWGQNGNSNISTFQYLSTFAFSTSNVYYFGTDKKTPSTGAYADILKNPNVSWETAEQIDLGVDARFLNSRLGVVFDWYQRTTKDWLVDAPILSVYGLNAPYINGGDVVNKGVEVALNWQDNAGDFRYGGGVNFTHNTNKVTRLDNAEGIIHGDANVLSQGTTEMYRVQVDYPIGYFYGYKTDGVFQNWEQVNATTVKYQGSQPGDLIFVDTDGNGIIDENDRTMIGNPHPKYQLGLNFNVGYKGFDLNVATSGAFGQQIAKSYRSFADSPLQNYTTDIFGRWTGEGTSDKLPRLTAGSHVNWQNISDIYIENGDYMKIQNITLGYDFKKLLPKLPLAQARLYFTAQNLFTFTAYSGMDPEIGFGNDKSWVTGVDLGYYPSSRSYLIGVNLKF
ncbi:MAG: TonB-dependent receptor [Tannerellaceae bacterium]|jgi:TonB-linked SusC/RagA family outer membrane protein|nr:TonB-dependent receptor [Tannerellaceae bacterium]